MKKSIRTVSTMAGIAMFIAASHASAALVSYYSFDDGATVTDQKGSNDGTLIYNAGFSGNTPDGSANSLDLSATGVGSGQDYVRIGAPTGGPNFNISTTNSFTISMWVNYTSSARGIVSIRHDLTHGGNDRSGITFGIQGANPFVGIIPGPDTLANTGTNYRDITTNQTVSTGTWTHMVATYNGSTDMLTVYVNGVAATSYSSNVGSLLNGSNATGGAGSIDFANPDGSFTGFGASGNAPINVAETAGDFTRSFYDGLLDDVSIWDEALSGGDVQRLFNGESPLNIPETSSALLTGLGVLLLASRRSRKG